MYVERQMSERSGLFSPQKRGRKFLCTDEASKFKNAYDTIRYLILK